MGYPKKQEQREQRSFILALILSLGFPALGVVYKHVVYACPRRLLEDLA